MLFLAGKGDNTIGFYEVNERDPVLTEGMRHTGQQSKGACLVPKRALRVMDGEVDRVLQLTANAVIPVSYIVPRKSYREFHADLFPETNGPEAPMYASQWMSGSDAAVEKILLDPSVGKNCHVNRGPLSARKEEPKEKKPVPVPRKSVTDEPSNGKPFVAPKPVPRMGSGNSESDQKPQQPVPIRRTASLRVTSSNGSTAVEKENAKNSGSGATGQEEDDVFFRTPTTAQRRQMFQDRINSVTESSVTDGAAQSSVVAASPLPKRAARVFGRVSKFRHLHGTLMPRSTHLENFRGLDNALPTECNGFQANPERAAVPLNGPGGRIAILELKKGGRLPDTPDRKSVV